MSETPPLLEQISRYERARDELNEVIRGAHSATKALRQAERDARRAAKEVDEEARRSIDQRVEALVNSTVDEMNIHLSQRLDEGDRRIARRFNEVLAELRRLRAGHPGTPGITTPRKKKVRR